ncbi:uncharacterized protein N7487_003841 [Penicillium crustosum]|uniref:uncharacterized protein n=1 Tax=Penicillium crustosum TaxID=36656 RepID=UPI002386DBA8|nr:uncharacterized protein N7487_003841 [Penicillium crustosum]KAJ5409482.1 hypothetical protein N7487_003841 [Penicillium crustosum]
MIRQYLSSVSVDPRPCDSESTSQNETGQNETRQAPQQSPASHPKHQTLVTDTTIKSFGLQHYSLDGPSETPGDHQSSSASQSRRGNRTRRDTHHHQSTGQRSPENESSQNASPPPQIPRTPAIRPLRQTIPGWQFSDPIAIPPRRPSDGNDTIANYRAIGAQHQAWIAGPAAKSCPVERSRVTWADLIHNPLEEHSFEVYLNDLRSPPEEVGNIATTGLSMGKNWRYVFLRQWGHWDGGRQEGYTVYQHRTGLGAIFVENITRRFGPYWAQVAQAQYQLDNHIDTLQYVYFINVQNVCTWPYVESRLYPRHGLNWFDDYRPQRWTYGTREYQELLGTKLGRGVARLVLGGLAERYTSHRDHLYVDLCRKPADEV